MFVFSKGSLSTFNPIVDRKNKNSGKIVGSTVRESDGTLTPRSKKLIADYGKRFNIWKLTVQKQKGENVHPAPFPEQLAHDHIISWSNEGDTILDTFAGSGTTGKMAKKLNRNYILIEKEKEYIDIINKRLQ